MEMRKGRRERIEKGSRKRREKQKRQKGIEMTISRGGEGTSPLASACFQLPQGTAVLLQRHDFPTRFCSKALQQ